MILLAIVAALAACTDKGDTTVGDDPAAPPRREESRREETVHPAFDMTIEDLTETLVGLPNETVAAVSARPQVFLEYVSRMLILDPMFLVLVDKRNRLPESYAPPDLQDLNRYRDRLVLNREDLALRAAIMPDLFAMITAAGLEGITLDISSSYRSYAYQENLFEYWVSELGLEEAERVSARAGSSQHQLGTTIDFGSVTVAFAGTPAGRWLAANAGDYGFSMSYPEGLHEITGYSFEPWHFRYISRGGTRMEREFFDGIQQIMLEYWHRWEPFFRERFRNTGNGGARTDARTGAHTGE